MFGEMGDAIKAAGFKKLGKKMNEHYSIEQGNQASLEFYNKNSMAILGGNPLTQNMRLNKINDYMWTLDNRGEQILAQQKWMDKNIPDKSHFKKSENFFKKAIKYEEWLKTVKTNKSGLSRGADLKKYVKDMQDLSTEQFDILMKIIDKAYLKVKNK